MSLILSKKKEYIFKIKYFEKNVEKTNTYNTEPLVKILLLLF